jgi:hypothetical protein
LSEKQDPEKAEVGRLTQDDLIIDRALEAQDQDTLDHQPIADRVAELVATSETPLNVALFGVWGSGKSSFARLLEKSLERYRGVKLVTYNAWTFEGESLQRSFISSVASSLGMQENDNKDYIQFHSGLYEHSRSARFNLTADHLRRIALIAAGVAVAVLAFLAAVVAVVAYFAGADVLQQVIAAIPALLPSTAVTAALVTAIQQLVAGARVEVDASAPTQEQFRQKFRNLLDKARTDKHHDRLVFFIDELDRCPEDQVVRVLAAIRHFFDQPGSVFIVAADRDVIETALKEDARQATPLNPANPYYSSASEYIDKIFQHQLALPPLRGRRLTRFARDLVLERKTGLWTELRAAEDGRLRDQLVYVLVPSHVLSPRRVKVLLNAFATSYRIAQARGIDVQKNALALAKLTTLRTEFPLFAADLVLEPRLPTLLLNPPALSGRRQDLLDKHKLPTQLDPSPTTTATDTLLADADGGNEVADLEVLQRELLRRYLVRTNQIHDPSRDLLYLEPAGAAVDLADQEFGQLLEAAAVEDPDRIAKAAVEQAPEEMRKAMRVLADMVSQEFGQERTNVTTALLSLAGQLGFEVAPYGPEVLGALKVQRDDPGLQPPQLAPALAVALKIEGEERSLSKAILDHPDLMVDAKQTAAVASIADGMSKDERTVVWDKVVEFYPTNPEILDDPVTRLEKEVAKEMLEDPALAKARRTRWNGLAALAAAEEIDDLLELAAQREGETEGIRGILLYQMANDQGNGYAGLHRHEADLATFTVRQGFRTMTAMLAIRVAPVTDWKVWLGHLDPPDRPWPSQGQAAINTAIEVVKRWTEVAASSVQSDATAVLGKLLKLMKPTDDEALTSAIEAPAQASLGSAAWWGTDAAATSQGQLQAALLRLGAAGPKAKAIVSQVVVADIERAYAPNPNEFAYRVAGERAGELHAVGLQRLATKVAEAAIQPPLLEHRAPARIALAKAAAAVGEDPHAGPFLVDADEMTSFLATPLRAQLLADWFSLEPPFKAGAKVAVALGARARGAERRVVAAWAAKLTRTERTDLLLRLAALANDASDWVTDLSAEDVDEDQVVNGLGERLKAATRGADRDDLARTIAALRPSQPSAQQAVGQLALTLLQEGKRTYDNTAAILFAALGTQHRVGAKLSAAVAAADARGTRFTNRALEDLRRANVPVRKRSVTEDFWTRFRWGRRR